MIERILEVIQKELNKTKVPIIYIIFLFTVILLFFEPNVLITLNVVEWVPFGINNLVITSFNLIYNNILWISLSVLIAIFIILLIDIYTNIFLKDYSKLNYYDGYVYEINPNHAVNKLIKLLVYLLTYGWVIYFIVIVILANPELLTRFIKDIRILEIENYFGMPYVNTVLFFINIVMAIHYIYRSLFMLRTKETLNMTEYHKIKNHFYIINHLNNHSVMLLKTKYLKNEIYFIVEKDNNDKMYNVLNKSNNFEEIHVHFKALY